MYAKLYTAPAQAKCSIMVAAAALLSTCGNRELLSSGASQTPAVKTAATE